MCSRAWYHLTPQPATSRVSPSTLFETIPFPPSAEPLSVLVLLPSLPSLRCLSLLLCSLQDLNGDQKVDYNEFLAATACRQNLIRDDKVIMAFEHFDRDGSGFISFDELVNIFGSEKHAREAMGAADVSGDGLISKEEFLVLVKAKEQPAEAPAVAPAK